MCGVVVPLAMPHRPQDERRQSKGLGAGSQVEACAELLNNRFLDACHKVAGRDGVQHRKAMRERQSEAAPKSSCSELIIDQPPYLIAIDNRGVIQRYESVKRKLALPHRMTAPRNYDVVLLRNRFHDEAWRKLTRIRKIANCKVKGSVSKLALRHREQPVKPTGLHLQLA